MFHQLNCMCLHSNFFFYSKGIVSQRKLSNYGLFCWEIGSLINKNTIQKPICAINRYKLLYANVDTCNLYDPTCKRYCSFKVNKEV